MRSLREALHELDLLVLQAEPTSTTIAPFLTEHVTLMGVALGLTVHEVLALTMLPDEPLVFYLAPALRQHWARQKQLHAAKKVEQTDQSTTQLSATARWRGERAELDAHLLLGSLRAVTQKAVLFSSPFFEVTVAKSKLRELARAIGHRDDLTAFVNHRGLHLHWRQGKGRLLLYSQPRRQHDQDVLVVSLRGASAVPPLATAAE